MPKTVLVDYGCHAFTYRLATRLSELGFPIRYFVNGSIESPNLTSLAGWMQEQPSLVRRIDCDKPYSKLSLTARLCGELRWTKRCTQALDQEKPSAVIVSTVPLAAVAGIQKWTHRQGIPLIYWLQDLQGRAIHDLLGQKLRLLGRVLGSFAHIWEQHIMEMSRMVITIAAAHESELPLAVRQQQRHALLENWANIEDFPRFPSANEWSSRQGIDKTRNIVYSGTLGLKHDISTFFSLASFFSDWPDVRIVVVSSGHAAEVLRSQAVSAGLSNLLVLPFQPCAEVPKVLASAAVLIAPLDASAGSFCVPSKVLSYFCAGRPTVIAINSDNPAAINIQENSMGAVVSPGDASAFQLAVARLLNNAPEREAAGARARAYAERTFNIDHVTQKFLRIISASNISLGGEPGPLTLPTAKSVANV